MIVCATMVVDGRVLLVRHSDRGKPDYGHWLLPAGRVEPGETLEEALKREMEEELGLEVSPIRRVDERVDSYTGDRFVNFLCSPVMAGIKISEELEDARWFSLDEVEEVEDIHPGLKRFLIEGFENGSFIKSSDW